MIDATAACLAEKGVAGTSVRSICMRAGVSSGLLRHYFDGVDALIAETYRATRAQLSETVNAAAAPAGKEQPARLHAHVPANFPTPEIGRASWWGRGFPQVEIRVVAS